MMQKNQENFKNSLDFFLKGGILIMQVKESQSQNNEIKQTKNDKAGNRIRARRKKLIIKSNKSKNKYKI